MNNPLKDTPDEVTETLMRWGGKNRYGEPNWRIIRAENHLVQRAGMWTEFEHDVEQTQFRTVGNQVRFQHREIAPDAIRVGTFWVPLYQVHGWILERWFPSSAFGSREQWESARSTDGTPMMGPFPERGGYFMLSGGGPWSEIPLLDSIRAALSVWENSNHSHGEIEIDKIDLAVRRDVEQAAELEEKKYAEFLREVEYQRLSHLGFIRNNPALTGFRNNLVNAKGLMSHL